MYRIMNKGQLIVNPESFVGQYTKYHHRVLSEIILEYVPFDHHKLI